MTCACIYSSPYSLYQHTWHLTVCDCLCRAGGVVLISGTGRITLDNTLDERLRLLEDRVRTHLETTRTVS